MPSLGSASGDGFTPQELTPTLSFLADDDINVVVTAGYAAQTTNVALVLETSDGERLEFEPVALAAGESHVIGMDWEAYGQPWPSGTWFAELYADDVYIDMLVFTVGE